MASNGEVAAQPTVVEAPAKQNAEVDPSKKQGNEHPPFDLKIAVLTAALSFEAYNDPQITEDTITEKHSDVCTTHYLSSDFARLTCSGHVNINLIKAENVPNVDVVGKSDPFVKLSVGAFNAQSTTIQNDDNPVWNEKFSLQVHDPSSQSIKVSLWDENYYVSSKDLGSKEIPINDLIDGNNHSLTLEVTSDKGVATLYLEAEYKAIIKQKESKFWFHELLHNFFEHHSTKVPPNLNTWGLYGPTKDTIDATSPHEDVVSKVFKGYTVKDSPDGDEDGSVPEIEGLSTYDKLKLIDMFKSSEFSMQAWAVLFLSLTHSSLADAEFRKICFIENTLTDTQATVWWNKKEKRVVFAFHGAQTSKIQDVISDVRFIPVDFGGNVFAALFGLCPKVHHGFLVSYNSIKSQVLAILNYIIESDASDLDPTNTYGDEWKTKKWHIYSTGHGLGGALATLFTKDLASPETSKSKLFDFSMYNFGSPRVGDEKFANSFNKAVVDSWRVANLYDVVPFVPKFKGYRHVSKAAYFQYDPTNEADVKQSFDVSEGGDLLLEDFLGTLLLDYFKGNNDIIKSLVQAELGVIKAINDGSAVRKHLQDYYFTGLLQLVEKALNGN